SLLFSLAIPAQAIESGIHAGAWRGPLIQKNLFARVLVLFCIASYLDRSPSKLWNGLRLLTVLLCILLIVLSNSKSGLAILILLLGFIILQRFIYRLFLKNPITLVPALCATLLATISALGMIVFNADTLVGIFGKSLTLSGRTTIWSALITKISERPLLGYGYEGFWKGIYGESSYVGKVFGTTYIPPHSHNGILELTLAFGFIGLGFFLVSFFANMKFSLSLPVFLKSYESYWPLVYLCFLVLYNQTESTLVSHNSIFWALYVSLTFSKANALIKTSIDNQSIDHQSIDYQSIDSPTNRDSMNPLPSPHSSSQVARNE
ncbi:MAG: O-antigen ligase family protein, partial [Limnothrix sp. RL_2_0]|nr:O-antigen ligase family protein [Limnothrix sp. RL_2_0]